MDPPGIGTVTSDLRTVSSGKRRELPDDSMTQFHRGPCDRAGKGQFDHHFGAGRGAAAHVDPPAMVLHNLPGDSQTQAEAGGLRGKVGSKDLLAFLRRNAGTRVRKPDLQRLVVIPLPNALGRDADPPPVWHRLDGVGQYV